MPVNIVETPARMPLTRRNRHHYYIPELLPDKLAAQGPSALPAKPLLPRSSWYRGRRPSSRFFRHEFAYGKGSPLRHVGHGEPTPNAGELHDVALPAHSATSPKVESLPLSLVDIVPKSELDPSSSAPLAARGRALPPAAPQLTLEPGSAAPVSTVPVSDNAPDPSLGTGRNPIANFPKPATDESGPTPAAAPGPSAQSDVSVPLVIAEKDANAIHDCAGRDVTVAASDRKLFLSGVCHSVTIRGSQDNVLVEISNTGKLVILGDHNAVIWSSGSDGPDPVVVSADGSNTVIHLRAKSDVSAPLVTMETTRLASGPSLNQ